MIHRLLTFAITASLFGVGCSGGSDGAAPTTAAPVTVPSTPVDTATATTTVTATTPSAPPASSGEPDETSNPEVVSRRTALADVDVASVSSPVRPGTPRASVPVDAWPAIAVDGETLRDADAIDPLRVEYTLSVCELVAVWALPHPQFLVIGYEEHPDIDCAVPNEVPVVFEIAASGLNSEGRWDYDEVPEIRELRKVGSD